MDLVRIKYSGRKAFKDKASKTSWNPGDSKLVTVDTARRLNKFAEFEPTETGTNTETEMQTARVLQNEIDRSDKQELDQVEGVLLTIESMDKGALEAYASKYETNIDKRKSVADLRTQVAGLVEQFGAR